MSEQNATGPVEHRRGYWVSERMLIDVLAVISFLEQDASGVFVRRRPIDEPLWQAYREIPSYLFEFINEMIQIECTDVQSRIVDRLVEVALDGVGDYSI